MKHFGKFLKLQREKAGLSQKDISDHLGYTAAQFVSNVERGLVVPPDGMVKAVVTLCKVKPKAVFEAATYRYNKHYKELLGL